MPVAFDTDADHRKDDNASDVGVDELVDVQATMDVVLAVVVVGVLVEEASSYVDWNTYTVVAVPAVVVEDGQEQRNGVHVDCSNQQSQVVEEEELLDDRSSLVVDRDDHGDGEGVVQIGPLEEKEEEQNIR